MNEIRYRPGKWFGIVSEHGVALLPDVLDEVAVKQVWASFAEGRGLAGVLEALTGALGVGLMALPPFAVVALEGGLARVAVRGDLVVTVVESADAAVPPSVLSGEGVTTWSERMIASPVSISVRQKGGRRGSALSLPISSGVVLCSQLTSTFSGTVVEADPVDADPVAEFELVAEPTLEAEVNTPITVPEQAEAQVELEGVATTEAAAVATATPSPAVPAAVTPFLSVPADPTPAPADPTPAPADPTLAPVEEAGSDLDEWGYSRETTPPPDEPASEQTRLPELTLAREQTRIPVTEPVSRPEDEYDHLFGATVARVVEDAAVRVTEEGEAMIAAVPGFSESASAPASADDAGDHDGHTISIAELRSRQGAAPIIAGSVDPADAVGRGPIARLEISSGDVVDLDRPVVIGRRPSTGRALAGELPHLVTVSSPMQDISRSHIEVRAEGIHVIVRDLDTVNGTVLRRDGRAPVRLTGSESVLVVGGDVLDLGDGVTVTIRELT